MKKQKLQKLRADIDQLDAQLLRLLNQRARLSQQVGRAKRSSGKEILDLEREESILRSLEKKNKGPISAKTLRTIFREIISSSQNLQKPLKVACLGPEGSYSHQAVIQQFSSSAECIYCRSFAEGFEAASREEADFAVVPIENSIEGGVNATHDCLVHTDLTICGEQYVKIDHVLCASPKHGVIKTIYSHPQALGQCRQWLLTHYPEAEQIEVSSTSEGPRRAKTEKNAAAISSRLAAQLSGLKILARNIADMSGNTTRFLILGRTPPSSSPKKSKTSLIFAVAHEVGALNAVLQIFADNRLNLQKIESRPAPHKTWEYLFFVDVKGHHQQPSFVKALNQIRKKTLWLKILGSYQAF